MTRTGRYVTTLTVFLSGLLLVTAGAQGETEVKIFGAIYPVFVLTRAVGMIAMFAAVVISLATYGNSLPLTRTEVEGRMRGHSAYVPPRGATKSKCEPQGRDKIDTARQTTHPVVHSGRISTEAQLRLVVMRKRERAEREKTPHALHTVESRREAKESTAGRRRPRVRAASFLKNFAAYRA
jgi:hypothetical protein